MSSLSVKFTFNSAFIWMLIFLVYFIASKHVSLICMFYFCVKRSAFKKLAPILGFRNFCRSIKGCEDMEFRHALSSCAEYTLNQVADDCLANDCKPCTNTPHKFSRSVHRGSLLVLLFSTWLMSFILIKEKSLSGRNVQLFLRFI